jgi:hypothetical protein
MVPPTIKCVVLDGLEASRQVLSFSQDTRFISD